MASDHATTVYDLLDAAGITNVRIGQPNDETPDNTVFIVPTGGFSPDGIFGGTAIRRSTFQIRVRAKLVHGAWSTAYSTARTAYEALDYVTPSGTVAVRITTEIQELERDKAGRLHFSFNCVVGGEE